jgi:hypothetical protein
MAARTDTSRDELAAPRVDGDERRRGVAVATRRGGDGAGDDGALARSFEAFIRGP